MGAEANPASRSRRVLEVESPRVLAFHLPERNLGATAVARQENQEPITVTLRPCGQIDGRVLAATGKPAAGRQVSASGLPPVDLPQLKHNSRPAWFRVASETAKTDAEGRFKIRGVVPGLRYEVAVRDDEFTPGQPSGDKGAAPPAKKQTPVVEPEQTVTGGGLGSVVPATAN